jgi:CubicO group peptidase (beta-lactamase class C family)
MNRTFIIFFIAMLLITPRTRGEDPPVVRPEEVGMSSSKLANIATLMNKQVADQQVAGVVVIVARKGKVVYFESFGKRDIAADLPMEKDTIFFLASLTKPIVTAAAMMLVDDGKIQLDTPVATYLLAFAKVKVRSNGQLIPPTRPMTVADLMRHTSGIGPGDKDPKIRVRDTSDLNDFVEQLSTIPLRNHPGEEWYYSNSIDVLGAIVEKASGKSLDVFLHERLLDPLGMKDTEYWVVPAKRDRLASCYWRNADGLKPFKVEDEARFFKRPTVLSGSGGLFSTAEDYARFLMMIAAGGQWGGRQYLKPESVKLMTSNQLPPAAQRSGFRFGFGFSVRTGKSQPNAEERTGEFWWSGAVSTHFWGSPNDDQLVVVTMEQTRPRNTDTETLLTPVIYDAIVK